MSSAASVRRELDALVALIAQLRHRVRAMRLRLTEQANQEAARDAADWLELAGHCLTDIEPEGERGPIIV